ncbi:hypothetical protein [uncultured Methanoregula sp.]|uniref:hypothetical protein n=1 Tax=uncultured Methanoregula sp. TaxID=1005933 RepID=UPI002AAB7371|nr:hypothetical protein [uncultured Methanoregula sp.]
MSQIIIETDAIKKATLYFFALVGIVAMVSMIALSTMDHFSSRQVQPVIVPEVAAPTPAPAPTIVPASAYPSVLEFTVLSTTVSNGHYTVYTTTGQTLYMPDYASWNSLWPRHSYIGTITGAETNGALDISTINLISTPSSYPLYYHYNLNYYQYDGRTIDPVAWKETLGHQVIEGRPPHFPEEEFYQS